MSACKFINVGSSKSECKENFSGVGQKLFLFQTEDLTATPEYDETGKNEFTESSFTFAEGKGAVEVFLKPKSGKVTSSTNGGAGGFSSVFTCVVDKDMDSMSTLSRALNNAPNFGAMVSDGTGGYYVFYTEFGIQFSDEFDSGDTPDSDHGHTLTITASPMRFPTTKWKGTLTMQTEEGSV